MKLKGNMVIEMIDDATGEVVERVQEENMVTNAVNHILGLNPMGIFYSVAGEYDTHLLWNNNLIPICPNMIGGILLYSEALTEDADNIYPSTAKFLVLKKRRTQIQKPCASHCLHHCIIRLNLVITSDNQVIYHKQIIRTGSGTGLRLPGRSKSKRNQCHIRGITEIDFINACIVISCQIQITITDNTSHTTLSISINLEIPNRLQITVG